MPGYTRAPQAPSVPATVMVAVMGAAVVTRVATQAVLASRLLAAVAVQSNVAFVEPDRTVYCYHHHHHCYDRPHDSVMRYPGILWLNPASSHGYHDGSAMMIPRRYY